MLYAAIMVISFIAMVAAAMTKDIEIIVAFAIIAILTYGAFRLQERSDK